MMSLFFGLITERVYRRALILHYINDNDGSGMSKKLSYRKSDGPSADDSDEGDGDDYGGR